MSKYFHTTKANAACGIYRSKLICGLPQTKLGLMRISVNEDSSWSAYEAGIAVKYKNAKKSLSF